MNVIGNSIEVYKNMAKSATQDSINYKKRIDKAIKYINHYETIRGYYEYQELGYDEYNYDDDLKKELLEILDKENN